MKKLNVDLHLWQSRIRLQGQPRPISFLSLERWAREKRLRGILDTLSAASGLAAAMGIAVLIPLLMR